MTSKAPVVHAAYHPESDHWLVDTDPAFVRDLANMAGIANVRRIDIPALLAVAEAARAYRAALHAYYATGEGGGSYTAAEVALYAALDALEVSDA